MTSGVADQKPDLPMLDAYLHPSALFVVISGPSGVGKDAVVHRLREMGVPFRFVVTATDRPRREGEVHGVDYIFCSTGEFECMIAADELLEYANVYGQYKGVPRSQVRDALAAGIDVIMRVDVKGAATLRRLVPAAVMVFVAPPSLEVLMSRLQRRGADTPEQTAQRVQMAQAEMERIGEFDYVVVNHEGDLDGAARHIRAIIEAEKCRTHRAAAVV